MPTLVGRVLGVAGLAIGLALPAYGQGVPAGRVNLDARLTTFGDPNDPMYTSIPPFLDGLARLAITRPSGTFGCSGALVGGGHFVLTAAHCVSGSSGAVSVTALSATFAAAAGAPIRTIDPSAIFLADGWNGDFRHGSDLALLPLSFPVAATSYEIVRDPSFGQGQTVMLAGYGRSGNGNQSNAPIGFGTLRFGTNEYDTVWSASDVIGAPFAFDFDNGTTAQDTIGNVIPQLADLGSGVTEVLIAPGDSGGPSFVNGRIIGVHSFGGTFGAPFDINSLLDASFGELGGDVRIALYANWFDSVIAVPEPESYALMLVGLGVVAAVSARRRRRSR